MTEKRETASMTFKNQTWQWVQYEWRHPWTWDFLKVDNSIAYSLEMSFV